MIALLQSIDRPKLLSLTQTSVFVLMLLAILMPFSSPFQACGAFVLQIFWMWRDHGRVWPVLRGDLTWQKSGAAWLAVAALIAYFVVRIPPEPLSSDAMYGVFAMILFALSVWGAWRLFPYQNEDVQAVITRGFIAAFAVGAAVHAFEVMSGFAGRRLLWNAVPALRPRMGKFSPVGESVGSIVDFIANHDSAMLAALMVPILLLVALSASIKLPRPLVVVASVSAGLAAIAINMSSHATSKAGLFVGGLTWLLVSRRPRAAQPLMTAVWLAATLLVLPAAWIGYHAEGWRSMKPFSAQHRVVIWGVTAEKTLEHPLLGIGLGKTPLYDESPQPSVKYIPGTRLPIATNRHAHNIFLQTWYETGVIGALLLMLAGLPLIGWISRTPPKVAPLLAAAFTGSVISASFSYSMLATWFLATFTLTLLFCRFVLELAPAAGLPQRSS